MFIILGYIEWYYFLCIFDKYNIIIFINFCYIIKILFKYLMFNNKMNYIIIYIIIILLDF